MSALAEHFALLDNERDHDDVGPYIPLRILPPWEQLHDKELWGETSVRRIGDHLEIWAVLEEPDDPSFFQQPFARLPETMRGIDGAEIDWRTMMKLRVEPDGYCYVEPVDG